MNVSEALKLRTSVRGFLPTPVEPAVIRRVLANASRAPSGGNLQPWHIDVLGGEDLAKLKAIMAQRIQETPMGEGAEYDIYPKELAEPYKARRQQVGEAMYGHIGIPRENKIGRLMWFARNFQFFGAPLALFCTVDRRMGPPQWSDLGMFLQSVMLLLKEEGLDSCPQECWAIYPKTLGDFLAIPPERMLFCGMAIGHRDPAEPANKLYAERVDLEEFASFRGI